MGGNKKEILSHQFSRVFAGQLALCRTADIPLKVPQSSLGTQGWSGGPCSGCRGTSTHQGGHPLAFYQRICWCLFHGTSACVSS